MGQRWQLKFLIVCICICSFKWKSCEKLLLHWSQWNFRMPWWIVSTCFTRFCFDLNILEQFEQRYVTLWRVLKCLSSLPRFNTIPHFGQRRCSIRCSSKSFTRVNFALQYSHIAIGITSPFSFRLKSLIVFAFSLFSLEISFSISTSMLKLWSFLWTFSISKSFAFPPRSCFI